jgi:hypothetical protein
MKRLPQLVRESVSRHRGERPPTFYLAMPE